MPNDTPKKAQWFAALSIISSIVTIFAFATGQSSIHQVFGSAWKAWQLRSPQRPAGEPSYNKEGLENKLDDKRETRYPYERKLLDRTYCGTLQDEWADPTEGDGGLSFSQFNPDPWLECQEVYLAALVEEYKLALERQDAKRKTRWGFSPIAGDVFKDFKSNQEVWADYRQRKCEEEMEIIGAQGSGSARVWRSCMAAATEERIGTIAELKQKADDF